MGLGDEIMAMGVAEKLWVENGKRVLIVTHRGASRKHEIWENHPGILHPNEARKLDKDGIDYIRYVNNSRCRPYVDYKRSKFNKMQTEWVFTNWRANDYKGHMYLNDDEKEFGQSVADELGEFIVIAPCTAVQASTNKQWGFHKWQRIVDVLSIWGQKVVQFNHDNCAILDNVLPLDTPSFRDACAILNYSKLLIGNEGAICHAAAYLNTPAVVVYGGFNSPINLGYSSHTNLYEDHPKSPCGVMIPCSHCIEVLDKIGVKRVLSSIETALS